MAKINSNYKNLPQTYLFSEIAKKTKVFSEDNPDVEILRLGIGNTTESLVPMVIKGLMGGVKKLGNTKTYTGYGDEQGDKRLRQALVNWYKKRGINLSDDEIFISDGAKTDVFGPVGNRAPLGKMTNAQLLGQNGKSEFSCFHMF